MDCVKAASGFEILAARLWNVLNEGKSFHPVFVLGVFLLLHVGEVFGAGFWGRALPALLILVPLVVVFVRYDFPLKLRWALWVFLAAFVLVFRFVDVGALALALGLYVFFTVFFWGTFYYHLRTGAPRTNFVRFWRLVLENPDSTSGNFLEQVPKALLCSRWSTWSRRRSRLDGPGRFWLSRLRLGSAGGGCTGGSSTGSRCIRPSLRRWSTAAGRWRSA